MIKKFLRDESGAAAIEYGLIAALVSVLMLAALTAKLTSTFPQASSGVK